MVRQKSTMESIAPWLTPALLLALAGLFLTGLRNLRTDLTKGIADLKSDLSNRIEDVKSDLSNRIDDVKSDLSNRIDDLKHDTNHRLDKIDHGLAEQRERMAKLEGSLEGFLAGRHDRDAA